MISIKDLTFEYISGEEGAEPVRAIDGLSLEIEKGSFVAVIGRNGSGKSTLAKCINGLLLPSSGKVLVKGMDTSDEEKIWDIRQTAGMVFQNPDNQLVATIVEDDVAFGPENLGVAPSEIQERVDAALLSVAMKDKAKTASHLLSGGQKQRIAIAGVLAMRPECIVFDEPTAMLDPKGRKDVLDSVLKLHEEGITIVLITHFMEEAALADRIVVMDKGRIAMDGSPKEIFSRSSKLDELGLEAPLAARLAGRLRLRGAKIPEGVISAEELTEALCL